MMQGKSGFSDSYKRWQVYLNWRDLVGDIADYSTPVAYNGGILFISVEHSAYIQQLEFLKEQIKNKVNNFEKNWVKSIRLQLRQH